MANKELQINGGKFIDAEDIGNYIGNPNPIKLGKCLKELDRILDFKSGNNQYSASEKFSVPTTQSDYYEGLGIDERTARNYKKLTELVLIEKKEKIRYN